MKYARFEELPVWNAALRAWAETLQNSSIRGQRYLTEKAQRQAKARREREEFLEELKRVPSRGEAC